MRCVSCFGIVHFLLCFNFSYIQNKTDKVMQTDHFIDTEKEKLLREKESLRKEVSELKYEKAELHQRVESLQSVSIRSYDVQLKHLSVQVTIILFLC